MNEKIKQIALAAGFHQIERFDAVDGTNQLEKFAELIIRECEKVVKDGSWYYDAPSCGWRKPINFVCNTIKDHFGVKE